VRVWFAVPALMLVACASPASPAVAGDAADVEATEVVEMGAPETAPDDIASPETAPTDASTPDADDTSPDEVDVDPIAEIESHVQLIYTTSETVLLEATHVGFTPNIFGAQVYGETLKLWASNEEVGIEILVRLDQTTLPGSVTPGAPGGDAWVLLLFGEQDAYVTQASKGTIQIDACPDTPGLMISGQLDSVPLYNMSGMSPGTFTISGTFELVLGSVDGATHCSP
jgi:hypothetical protein